MNKLETALAYAKFGWKVLPLVKNGKIPATAHGVKDATTSKGKIKKWWSKNSELNIGVACGKESNLIVFDIDPRNGGDDSWEIWLNKNEGEITGATQITGGGGQHFICSHYKDIRSCKLADGIDLLSDGKYFVASPSVVNGKPYTWELSSDPFDGVAPSPIPQKWIEIILGRKKTDIPEGAIIRGNRNCGLMSLGGAMRSFGMTESEILAAISVANETRCEIPLPASEIKQIAKHAGHYAIDTDAAASGSVGASAAECILENSKTGYHFTPATSFLNQPAPLSWIIKNWIPANSTDMIYGESAVGKTFVALDMACCVAKGIDWCGNKVKKGTVGYLLGEGNFGFRQRVASWCKKNDVTELDDLLISNQAIDMDAQGSVEQILSALSEFDEYPELIFVDTINRHMSGDENSARDTRAMLTACGIVAAETKGAIVLVHHVGHGELAKSRARGSSAWKGALDAQIFVEKKNEAVSVDCKKMKDAQPPDPIRGKLEQIDLGWIDEDGENRPGMYFEHITEEEYKKANPRKGKTDKAEKARKDFEAAWWGTNAELAGGVPYVSRGALIEYLVTQQGITERTALQRVTPKGSLVAPLLAEKYLSKHSGGWLIVDRLAGQSLLLSRKGDRNNGAQNTRNSRNDKR